MLAKLREFGDKKTVKVDTCMIQDLNWFLVFAKEYNGTCKYVHQPLPIESVALDACPKGLGGFFGNNVYTFNLETIFVPSHFSISHLEMWNIAVCCKLWGSLWKGRSVQMYCDNLSCVNILHRLI